mmetsp:Transcript_28975/g.67941  ORF Transcript_28975/g.67941 Transcript_28975/m.67941 type:complete len:305 (+) Transcript_28975:99-1013(+)
MLNERVLFAGLHILAHHHWRLATNATTLGPFRPHRRRSVHFHHPSLDGQTAGRPAMPTHQQIGVGPIKVIDSPQQQPLALLHLPPMPHPPHRQRKNQRSRRQQCGVEVIRSGRMEGVVEGRDGGRVLLRGEETVEGDAVRVRVELGLEAALDDALGDPYHPLGPAAGTRRGGAGTIGCGGRAYLGYAGNGLGYTNCTNFCRCAFRMSCRFSCLSLLATTNAPAHVHPISILTGRLSLQHDRRWLGDGHTVEHRHLLDRRFVRIGGGCHWRGGRRLAEEDIAGAQWYRRRQSASGGGGGSTAHGC